MTVQDLHGIVADLAVKHAELADLQKQTERQLRDTIHSVDLTSKEIRELRKQLGGLGDKFGGFTEGMALPSMRKLLEERFHMDVIAPRVRVRKNGRTFEPDVLAYSHSGIDEVYVVEIKSHLREEGLEQMLRILREFRDFFPEHRDKKIFGILAAVDSPEDLARKVLDAGIYLARIHDDEFELAVPSGFRPRSY